MYGEVAIFGTKVGIKATYIVAIFKVPVLKVELLVQIPPALFGYTSI